MKSADAKLRLRKLSLITLLIVASASCANDLSLTPHVPDFQLEETRKYEPLTLKDTIIDGDPQVLPLNTVDGMYCFSKAELAYALSELSGAQCIKGKKKFTVNQISLPEVTQK